MALNKIIKFFATNYGKTTAFCLSSAATIGTFSLYYFPNTYLLDKYQNIVCLYKSGLSVPLTKTLKARFDVALDYCGIPEEDRRLYKPFHVVGFDMFSAGTSYSKYGSIIGIPVNFTYEDVETIDKNAIQVNGQTFVSATEEGQNLLNSLILSEDAQIYAMCREIKMCEYPKLLIHTFCTTICVAGTYALAQTINTKLNLYARPLSLRLILYSFVTAFAAGNYVLAKDVSQIYYEKKVDEELKSIDAKLVKGGGEFYSQILKRNIALRKLMGKEGESMYSILGNENYLFRQKHLPFVQRKDYFTKNVEYNI